MKKVFFAMALLFGVLLLLSGCEKEELMPDNPDTSLQVDFRTAEAGTIRDPRDGTYYKWIKLKDNNLWLAENMNYRVIGESWYYDNDENYANPYGYLYTWNAARTACEGLMGGWRLASDAEWQTMLDYYGKVNPDGSSDKGYDDLMVGSVPIDQKSQSKSGFDAVPGGRWYAPSGPFVSLGYIGDYWTNTELTIKPGYFYAHEFQTIPERTVRFSMSGADFGLSCRCFKKEIISGTFIDPRDNKVYRWAEMEDGNIWMAENLDYWAEDLMGHSSYYPKTSKKYSRLYNWWAVTQIAGPEAPIPPEPMQGICPDGWHLPTDADWKSLIDAYGGGKAGYAALMDEGYTEFDALLGGYEFPLGTFLYGNNSGYYWSSTGSAEDENHAWFHRFESIYKEIIPIANSKYAGFSCRCIKDQN